MSWTTRAEGKDAKPISQIQAYSCFVKLNSKNPGLSLGIVLPSMTEAIGCNLAMFIFSYNFFEKNKETIP